MGTQLIIQAKKICKSETKLLDEYNKNFRHISMYNCQILRTIHSSIIIEILLITVLNESNL